MSEPAPPRITVTIPGRGEVPGELLAVGPPAPTAPPVPRGPRLVALAAVGVLVLGCLSAYRQSTAPPPPVVLPPAVGVAGVTATADRSPGGTDAVERLRLLVRVQAATGRGDSGGSPRPGGLVLVDVRARGFQVRLTEPVPLVLGTDERAAAGARTSRTLDAEVVVVDCSVETGAQRQVSLAVRRGDGPVGTVLAVTSPELVRALDRLVSRTCRRPRG